MDKAGFIVSPSAFDDRFHDKVDFMTLVNLPRRSDPGPEPEEGQL